MLLGYVLNPAVTIEPEPMLHAGTPPAKLLVSATWRNLDFFRENDYNETSAYYTR